MVAMAHATDVGPTPGTIALLPAHPLYEQAKRAVDCTVSAVALVALSPLWLAIAGAIRLDSRGPVLFKRTVVGRNGVPFVYYKFRTMQHGNDDAVHRRFLERYVREDRPFAMERDARTGEDRPVFKVVHDPRVTRVGRWLRRSSLDEIPQLINVLRGEMSIVGPRPPIEYEYALYDDARKARLLVPPGLTGLSQVTRRGRISFAEMCVLDLDYIKRRSLLLDLRLMLATVRVLARGE